MTFYVVKRHGLLLIDGFYARKWAHTANWADRDRNRIVYIPRSLEDNF
jgi:hypothetical protein